MFLHSLSLHKTHLCFSLHFTPNACTLLYHSPSSSVTSSLITHSSSYFLTFTLFHLHLSHFFSNERCLGFSCRAQKPLSVASPGNGVPAASSLSFCFSSKWRRCVCTLTLDTPFVHLFPLHGPERKQEFLLRPCMWVCTRIVFCFCWRVKNVSLVVFMGFPWGLEWLQSD